MDKDREVRLVLQPLNPEPLPPCPVLSLIISLFTARKGDFHNARKAVEVRAERERSGEEVPPQCAVGNDAVLAPVFKRQQGCFSFTRFLTSS